MYLDQKYYNSSSKRHARFHVGYLIKTATLKSTYDI